MAYFIVWQSSGDVTKYCPIVEIPRLTETNQKIQTQEWQKQVYAFMIVLCYTTCAFEGRKSL